MITEVIQGGTKLEFSPERILFVGFFLIGLPFVGFVSSEIENALTHFIGVLYDIYPNKITGFLGFLFRYDYNESDMYYSIKSFIMETTFILFVFLFLSKLIKHKKIILNAHHPILKKVTSMQIPLLLIMWTIFLALGITKQEHLVPSIFLIILGILLFLYGTFSRRLVKNTAIILILIGISAIFFSEITVLNATLIAGLSYLGMGTLMWLDNKRRLSLG